MSQNKCDSKLMVCATSALNEISKRIGTCPKDKTVVSQVCKDVAKEFNNQNPGANVKWDSLRKSYQRNQAVSKRPKNTTPIITKKELLEVAYYYYDKSTNEEPLKEELKKARKMINHMVVTKNTQRAESNVPDMPSIPPPPQVDSSNVMVDKAELSKLVTCEAELLLLKEDFKAMRSLLTPEQKMLFDNKDSKSDSTFDNIVAEKRKVSKIVADFKASN